MLTFTNDYVNLIMDGNSIIAGDATSVPNRIGEKLMQRPPINGMMTYKNTARGGRTYMDMINNVQNVHNAFEAGKQNLLFFYEAGNSAAWGLTGTEIVAQCRKYINLVKATHPEWRLFLILSVASQDDKNPSEKNRAVDYYNNFIRTNYKSLGIEAYVDTRPPGGPLAYVPPYNYDESRFTKSGLYQDGIHLNAAGNEIVAQYIADMLPTIPDVAPTSGGEAPSGVGGDMLIGFTFI
jgi:lysophospholipase L1-like esterase